MTPYDVFISYRRDTCSEIARLIQLTLESKNIKVFIDVENLDAGYFNDKLLDIIKKTPNFLLIISKNTFDHITDPEDCFRKEIEQAIITKRNIVPLLLDNFRFPGLNELPPILHTIPLHNSINYHHEYFKAVIEKLIKFLIIEKPLEKQSNKSNLSLEEISVLECLRGKPDVNWTKEIISQSILYNGVSSNFSFTDLSEAINSLLHKGYLNIQQNGRIIVTQQAIAYYRAKKS